MNRSDFQQLYCGCDENRSFPSAITQEQNSGFHTEHSIAELRAKEADILLNQSCLDGAYYLLGYAVECAFKACIAKQTKQYDFPPDRRAIEAIYQHDPNKLLSASGLALEHQRAVQANTAFAENWKIVQVWSEQARYQVGKSEAEVRNFYSAVVGSEGVLPWLKKYW
jgi:hypothetical protein